MDSIEKSTGTCDAKLVFFDPLGSAGHVVHFDVSRSRYVDTRFSCLGGPGVVYIKSAPGYVTPNLCVLHPMGYVGHVVHSGGSGARNIDTFFSWSGGSGAVSIKSALGHVTLNLCFCIQCDLWVT
jgi:hypothetical protein